MNNTRYMDDNKKKSPLPFGSEEEFFWGEIYVKEKLLFGKVKCKLILNRINYNVKPILLLYPTEEERSAIFRHFEVEIKGVFENVGQEKMGEIHIPKAYMMRSTCVSFAPSWDESIIEVSPGEIYLKHYLGDEVAKQGKSFITFFITDNEMVGPWGIITRRSTGEVKPEFRPRVILDYGQGWVATFERHYYYCDAKVEGVEGNFSPSQLVLTLEKADYVVPSISEIWEKERWVNNLLWYLSFGTRRRITWIRWVSVIGKEYSEYFRGIGVLDEDSQYESLIERTSIKAFLQHCLAYERKENHLDLYLPIIYLVGTLRMGITAEWVFLSLFISLEALLSLFMKSRGRGKYLNDGDWGRVVAQMKAAVNGLTTPINDADKAFLIGRLGNLNQNSMKVIYREFCKEMELDNSDLWPIYENQERDLYKIRNKLVHGERFEYTSFLGIANQHLRWIIERCLLKVLAWEAKTDVDRKKLYNNHE
jgi:hypothetical protein